MKNLKTLCKEFELNNSDDYFELIINSYHNGNITNSKELFSNMRKADKKEFFFYLLYCGINQTELKKMTFIFIAEILKEPIYKTF